MEQEQSMDNKQTRHQ